MHKKRFQSSVFYAALLASAISLSACESKGPGEIGSLDDVVVRNAGDPQLQKALNAEPTSVANQDVDPMIAEHERAAAEAQEIIDEQAANDPDDTPVPGDPVEEPQGVVASESKSEPEVETPTESVAANKTVKETIAEEQVIDEDDGEVVEDALQTQAEAKPAPFAVPMQGVAMQELGPMQRHAMHEPEIQAEPSIAPKPVMDEEAAEIIEPSQAKSVAKPKPVMEDVAEETTEPKMAEPHTRPKPVMDEPWDSERRISDANNAGLIVNPDKATVISVQKALAEKGYYFGAADGTLGTATLNAIYLYQSAHQMKPNGLTYKLFDTLTKE